jgi:hypothetical protein
MDRHPIGAAIEWLSSPLLQHLSDGLSGFFDLFVGIGGSGPRDRDKPVHIRMRKSANQPALPATSAGLIPGLLAQEQLSQPEGQPLFACPGRSSQEDHLRELATGVRSRETLPRRLVPDQWMQGLGNQAKLAAAEW